MIPDNSSDSPEREGEYKSKRQAKTCIVMTPHRVTALTASLVLEWNERLRTGQPGFNENKSQENLCPSQKQTPPQTQIVITSLSINSDAHCSHPQSNIATHFLNQHRFCNVKQDIYSQPRV